MAHTVARALEGGGLAFLCHACGGVPAPSRRRQRGRLARLWPPVCGGLVVAALVVTLGVRTLQARGSDLAPASDLTTYVLLAAVAGVMAWWALSFGIDEKG